MSTRVLLATRNAKKLVELQRILDQELGQTGAGDRAGAQRFAVALVGLADVAEFEEAPENELTFAGNALLKAREGVKHTGLPTVADDSGLEVAALGGMPGVFSARWAGKQRDDRANLELVLGQIEDLNDAHRRAAFVCVAALVTPDGREFTTEGRMRGHLVRKPRGDGGFGYDPIFVADGQTRTNAELDPATKDAISHRGQAFRALAQLLLVELG